MRWHVNAILSLIMHKAIRSANTMKRLEQSSSEAIENHQLKKLNLLINHFRTYPFYSKLLNDHNSPKESLTSLEQIKMLPVITKQTIRDNLGYIANQPNAKYPDSTSGSTGKNFIFYRSKELAMERRAANIVTHDWIGVDYLRDPKLVIWGNSPQTNRCAAFTTPIKLILRNNQMLQAYGMDEDKAFEFLQYMNKFKPVMLQAYPNYAQMMACVGRKRKIMPHPLKAIVLSGEMLLDHQKEEIESYFQCTVYNRYGSREFGVMAHECEHRSGLHILPSRFYLETDEHGELLVTDLDNYATPFIRYMIGDAGEVLQSNCPCGKSLQSIFNITGRSHDIIKTRSGKLLPGQFWTTLTRSVPGIREFQLVQHSKDNLELKIVIDSTYCEENESKLYHKLENLIGNEIKMTIKKVDKIEITPAGKRRFVIKMDSDGKP